MVATYVTGYFRSSAMDNFLPTLSCGTRQFSRDTVNIPLRMGIILGTMVILGIIFGDQFWGSFYGDQFWGSFLGTNFGDRLWWPILGIILRNQLGTSASSWIQSHGMGTISGEHFGAGPQMGSIFWGWSPFVFGAGPQMGTIFGDHATNGDHLFPTWNSTHPKKFVDNTRNIWYAPFASSDDIYVWCIST